MFFGGAVIVLLVAFVPTQARRLRDTRRAIAAQDRISNDLWTVALPRCPNGGRIGVVNHRLVPQVALPAAAGVLGVVAFCLLAAAGLPIITRYTFGIDAILAIFCGAGAFGWLLLMPGTRGGRGGCSSAAR